MSYMSRYYKSEHWIELSRRIRKERPLCEECLIARSTQVHHRVYNDLWNEKDSQLTAICSDCHKSVEDFKRKNKITQKKQRLKTKHTSSKKTSFLRKIINTIVDDN